MTLQLIIYLLAVVTVSTTLTVGTVRQLEARQRKRLRAELSLLNTRRK